MPILAQFHGKRFDLMLAEDDGTENGKCVLLTGTGRWRDGHLFLYRGVNLPEILIPDEVLDGLKPVAPERRGILEGPDYWLRLPIRPVKQGEVAISRPRQLAATKELAL